MKKVFKQIEPERGGRQVLMEYSSLSPIEKKLLDIKGYSYLFNDSEDLIISVTYGDYYDALKTKEEALVKLKKSEQEIIDILNNKDLLTMTRQIMILEDKIDFLRQEIDTRFSNIDEKLRPKPYKDSLEYRIDKLEEKIKRKRRR